MVLLSPSNSRGISLLPGTGCFIKVFKHSKNEHSAEASVAFLLTDHFNDCLNNTTHVDRLLQPLSSTVLLSISGVQVSKEQEMSPFLSSHKLERFTKAHFNLLWALCLQGQDATGRVAYTGCARDWVYTSSNGCVQHAQ